MNIVDLLSNSADRYAAAVALIDPDSPHGRRTLTYAQLWEQVRRYAAGLGELGLSPGDRVALLLANCTEYVVAFLAIASAGMTAVPLNIRLLEGELTHMLRDSGARLLIAHGEQLSGRPGLSAIPELGVALVDPVDGQSGSRRFEELKSARLLTETRGGGEDTASIMYTSGTTGLPKGVMLSHRAWLSVADKTRSTLDYGPAEVTLHTAPLTHGAGFLLLPTLAVGGVNVVCPRFHPARALDLFASEGVTNGFFVPSMIQMLLDQKSDTRRFDALRTIYYAGSPIDPGTLTGALERFGNVLIQSFGQMEVPMFLTVLDRSDHERIRSQPRSAMARSAGRVVPGVELKIVADDGQPCRGDTPGEIVVRGPHMMSGYWHRPDATADTMRDGWVHTGDVGYFDEQGYLYLVDRKKDMIISGGSNVYAREVEETLLAHPALKEAAVIGLPDLKWGELVCAVLVSHDGSPLADSELEQYCRETLPDYRRPRRFFWIPALPRNAYGKVLKRELRQRYADSGNTTH